MATVYVSYRNTEQPFVQAVMSRLEASHDIRIDYKIPPGADWRSYRDPDAEQPRGGVGALRTGRHLGECHVDDSAARWRSQVQGHSRAIARRRGRAVQFTCNARPCHRTVTSRIALAYYRLEHLRLLGFLSRTPIGEADGEPVWGWSLSDRYRREIWL